MARRGATPGRLLLRFLLLFSQFRLVEDGTMVLLNLPFALINEVIGLPVAGMPLSVSAAVVARDRRGRVVAA
jgi:Cu/Ag efflux pump CusA